jgi:hypothetical protein
MNVSQSRIAPLSGFAKSESAGDSLPPPEKGTVGVGVAGGKNRASADPLPHPPPFRGSELGVRCRATLGKPDSRCADCGTTQPAMRGTGTARYRAPIDSPIDSPLGQPRLAVFRGELRQGAERPRSLRRRRGDPSNLIRVMPAKGRTFSFHDATPGHMLQKRDREMSRSIRRRDMSTTFPRTACTAPNPGAVPRPVLLSAPRE